MTSSGPHDRYPFDLSDPPKGWATARVRDVVTDICPGFACGEHNRNGVGVPHLRPMNIDRNGAIALEDIKSVAAREDRLLRPGDVLFNNTNSAELVGKTAPITQDMTLAFSNHMTRLRPASGMTSAFLARQLHYLWMTGYFRHRCTHHVNQASISSATLADTVPVIVAPTREQERIIEKIDELFTDLDAGVAALERVQRNLERYRASVLKAAVEGRLTAAWRAEHPHVEPASELLQRILAERRRHWEADQLARFGAQGKRPPRDSRIGYPQPLVCEPGGLPPLPGTWCWAKLDQLLWYLRNGYGKKPDAEDGVPILRISALRPLSVNLGDVRFLSGPEERYAQFHLCENDLLFTRFNGNPDLVGVCGVVPPLAHTTVHPDKLFRGRTFPGLCLPHYLEIALNTGDSRRTIARCVKTTAGQAGISGSDLRAAVVPLPPLDEQAEIVSVFHEKWTLVGAARQSIKAALSRSGRLRQSILKRAFEGRLVPQDPADEPASALLARIRAHRSP